MKVSIESKMNNLITNNKVLVLKKFSKGTKKKLSKI